MPDITICTNQDCGLTDFCWRFNAPPKRDNQSYQKFVPDYEKNTCDFFWNMEDVSLLKLTDGETFP